MISTILTPAINFENVETQSESMLTGANGAQCAFLESCLSPKTQQSPFLITHLVQPRDFKMIQWATKRVLDFALTIFGLSFIIGLLVLVGLIIQKTSDGPIFFKQERIGLHGKRFFMYKFRSMYTDAEERLEELLENNETNGAMFKMENDPRVTAIGRFIRKYSIDEFPQLINVLKGEMSLVGPRPPIERELMSYEPWHYARFAALPGMTGAWQTGGRSSIKSFDDVVKLDYQYIRSWSLWKDLVILFKTPKAVLDARGAS